MYVSSPGRDARVEDDEHRRTVGGNSDVKELVGMDGPTFSPKHHLCDPQTIVTEETVIQRMRKDHLSGTVRLAFFFLTVPKRHRILTNPVCKLGLIIQTVDLASVFWKGSEGQNINHVCAKRGVNVIDQGLQDILLRGLVEGDGGESRFFAAVALEDGLVVLDGCAAVTKSSDDDMGTSR